MVGSAGKKEKLRDLLNLPDDVSDQEIEVQRGDFVAVVEMLGSVATRKKGASMVRKLAKDEAGARAALAAAGAIPPLVAMIGAGVGDEEALYACLNLGIRNDANKTAIVESGAVHRMMKLTKSTNGIDNFSMKEAIVANFFSLSALDSNKPVIGASGAIKFLVQIMKTKDRFKKSKQIIIIKDALAAIYNLSICHSNINYILEAETIPVLLKTLETEIDLTSRTLSILSNIASTNEGIKAIGEYPDIFPIIVEMLRWNDECQEKAAYILMVMAHKSFTYRKSMADAGAISALLEVTLLGSELAQKRASRVLEILTEKKKMKTKKMTTSSSFSSSSSSSSGYGGGAVVVKEEEEVRQLVRESLEKNMRRMMERADLVADFAPSDRIWRAFTASTSSSSSNSLPF